MREEVGSCLGVRWSWEMARMSGVEGSEMGQ